MAKIWDKITQSADSFKEKIVSLPETIKTSADKMVVRFEHKQLMNLRRNLEFVNVEIDELDAKYAKKAEAKANAFVRTANKKLAKPAFDACDKEEYINALLADKMQSFDKRAYMSHRAVNQSTARALFKATAKGEDTTEIFAKHTAKLAVLREKRNAYEEKLSAEREQFLLKNSTADETAYVALNATLEKQYEESCTAVATKLEEAKKKERATLTARAEKLTAKIASFKTEEKDRQGVADDVVLSVKNLKMYFGGLKAVDDLTFDVKKGEIFGLIGPNGAGKTTVFNCITRFYNATGGDVLFENKHGEVVDMRDFKVHDVILQGISRTFQNIELVREISVLENLLVACTRSYRTGILAHAIGLPLLKKEDRIFKQKAMGILKFMGIENYAGWLAMGLPYGILKKVEIARALMASPRLIIMDEPAAGLNDIETKELTETIRRIRDTFGVTILLVEHDMGLVMNVCDTVCAISFGQMLAIGTTEEIQKNKAVQEAYLGVDEEEETLSENTEKEAE